MKYFKIRLLFILLFGMLCRISAYCAIKGEAIQVLIDGKMLEKKINLYTYKGDEYFKVRDVAKMYGARVVWHPITGKVSLYMNNRQIDFFIKSTKVAINQKKQRLKFHNHLFSGKLYVPAYFIFSEDFAKFSETSSYWNPETKIYTIEPTVNVGTPRFYSDYSSTRIDIELSEKLKHYFNTKKSGRIAVSFTRGRAIAEEIKVDDGVVKKIDVKTKGRQAITTIYLAKGAGKVTKRMLFDPKRLQIEIKRTKLAGKLPEYKAESGLNSSQKQAAVSMPAAISGISGKTAKANLARKKKIIVLDAGHGGQDPGAIGHNGVKEKNVNLKIVKELVRLFKNDPNNGYEVMLTRDDDTFIALVERTNMANEKQADLFISIHCNASMKKKSRGFEIYFLSEKASDSEAAATAVLENSVIELEGKPTKKRARLQELLWSLVVNEFINESSELCCLISEEVTRRIKIGNRGVKQAGFHVLRGAQMPAVLVECAFLSNLEEESRLRTKRFQRKCADAIYAGIKRYTQRKNGLNARK